MIVAGGEEGMIRDPALLMEFENAQVRAQKPDYHRNLEIFEALYSEAAALGIFPLTDPLEGIEIDIRLAKAIHVQRTA